MMRKILKMLVSARMIILAALGGSLYAAVSFYHLSLWYVLGGGVVLGLIFGKVFCRWVCPIGLLMEILMSFNKDGKFSQMYQYHKVGCPIAWITGYLNKLSFLKIRFDSQSCNSCGICDKKCYLVAVDPARFSLYKPAKESPGLNYSCSKCLECVVACPKGSLKYKI